MEHIYALSMNIISERTIKKKKDIKTDKLALPQQILAVVELGFIFDLVIKEKKERKKL